MIGANHCRGLRGVVATRSALKMAGLVLVALPGLCGCDLAPAYPVDVPLTVANLRWSVMVQVGDAAPFAAMVDTGSSGLRILPGTVPDSAFDQVTTTPSSYGYSTTLDLTSTVAWSSGNTAAATIGFDGIAQAIAVGTSTMTATLGSVTGSALLTVTPPVLATVSVLR